MACAVFSISLYILEKLCNIDRNVQPLVQCHIVELAAPDRGVCRVSDSNEDTKEAIYNIYMQCI